jgi:hypothetical protein
MPDNINELYHTDLFRAILENQARGHPILKTLLFLFCPMAVRWWLNGTDPTVPYDPVWDAMTEFASGETLKQVIECRGFSEMHGVVMKYLDTVTAYQRFHPNKFPEPSQVFPGAEKALAPYGYQNETTRFFGGDFRNVELFVRTWAFVIPEWRTEAGIPSGSRFMVEKLAFHFSGADFKPIIWQAWSWVITTNPIRTIVGLLVNENYQNQLLFSLATYGVFHADKTRNQNPRQHLPDFFALNRSSHRARPFQAYFDPEKLVNIIPDISKTIRETDCLPIAAINNPSQCLHCGFHFCCYSNDGSIRPEVYCSLSEESERDIPFDENRLIRSTI